VDLGLIYDVRIQESRVDVIMTLTTPGCPMHESLAEGARNAVRTLPGVTDVNVEVVWDPPWDPSMMTATGKARLGMR
jgi:metal-sulfur cluster biosynthetic enzyme